MDGPSGGSAVATMPSRRPLNAQVSGRATRRAPWSAAASTSSRAARTLARHVVARVELDAGDAQDAGRRVAGRTWSSAHSQAPVAHAISDSSS